MAVEKILSTDTLETGFRSKYNETVDEIIIGHEWPATPPSQQGYILRLKKFGGGFININLQQFYYTKTELNTVLSSLNGSPYLGLWDQSIAATDKYQANIVVDYNGLFWRANANTTDADVPGVSNKWDAVLIPVLPYWISGTYNTNQTVRKNIGGYQYQFVSNVDENTDEPFLSSTTAPWTQAVQDGAAVAYQGTWSVGATYNRTDWVVRTGRAYMCLVDGTIATDPIGHSAIWRDFGVYSGVYAVGSYANNINVLSGSDLYHSNKAANTSPLTATNHTKWDLIGDNPNIPIDYPALAYDAGTALPIVITDFQTLYAYAGKIPHIDVIINSGALKGRIITSAATIDLGTDSPPTTVSIYADDEDGNGTTKNDILISIKP